MHYYAGEKKQIILFLMQPIEKKIVSHSTHVDQPQTPNETNNLQRIALLYFLIL